MISFQEAIRLREFASRSSSFASSQRALGRLNLNIAEGEGIELTGRLQEKSVIPVTRLLLVDDNAEMLKFLVEFLSTEFQIIGTLSSGSSVAATAARLNPDIILLDVDLGDMNGFAVAEQLRISKCRAKIVFLSVHESVAFKEAAEAFGATAYVSKSQIDRDLMKTLRRVA